MNRGAEVFRKAAVAFQTGDVRRAESLCRKARQLAPSFYGASLMLGLLLKRRGAVREAARELVNAARLAPNDFAAHYQAGSALMSCGELGQAVVYLSHACDLEPRSFEARSDLGTALRLAGRSEAAVVHYREAVSLDSWHPLGHNNLGTALCDLRQFDEALACFGRALELAPDLGQAHHNLGNALKELGRLTEAVIAYRNAVELRPDDRNAHSNLLYAMTFDPASDAAAIRHCAELYQSRHLARARAEILPPVSVRPNGQRLRIGYVCADFREHVFLMLLPHLIRDHNRDEFEVYCYSNLRVPDTATQLYVEHADHFRLISDLDDRAAASLIRKDRIDILVDITMHMAHGRLGVFAWRPAPLQVTWLAYPGTTGAACIDVRLSDPHLDPPGTDEHYTERTVRLPETFWCYQPTEVLPVSGLPAVTRGHLTFGCLNNFCKTNEATFALWARVLRALPTSRLLLLAPPGSARERTGTFFEGEQVDPARIEFVDVQPRVDYLKTYGRIDIVLDTLPYNGHTTNLDALWMGVPVVTLVGTNVAGRAGYSLAVNLGLEAELCAENAEDFCGRTVQLATDLERLATLRASLRDRLEHSPLMDSPRFARNFERTLREVYHRLPEPP